MVLPTAAPKLTAPRAAVMEEAAPPLTVEVALKVTLLAALVPVSVIAPPPRPAPPAP